jgi:deoxyadenosine/deoxycytidine kinase
MRAISPPDLMIYLKADIPKLVNQIKKRGRDYEESIDPNYLKSLNLLYKKFSEQYKHSKLIEIDVNDMDFVQNQDDFISITKSIEKSINLGKQLKIRKED